MTPEQRAQQVIEDLEGYGEQILTQQAVTVIAEALREAEARGRAMRYRLNLLEYTQSLRSKEDE